ncbi:MAG: MarR family transcriptional regulator for hemolysin [Candidatus Azotimanducaceae bacterium]|jgi:MarR family transcriptional regulator for hemolysin
MPKSDHQVSEQSFVGLLFNARNRIRFAFDEKFKPKGITDATWRTLFYLRQEGNGVSQKVLARTMGIEGPSLVRLLDSLSDKGLILRKVDNNDRRSKAIHLSSEANKLLTELDRLATEARQEILGDIPQKDIQTCIRVFNKILGVK